MYRALPAQNSHPRGRNKNRNELNGETMRGVRFGIFMKPFADHRIIGPFCAARSGHVSHSRPPSAEPKGNAMTTWKAKIGAACFSGMIAAVLIPGCVIRIGPSGGEEPAPTDNAETSGPADPAPLTPEEQEALDGLKQADPDTFARASLAGQYAAYALAGTIEANGGDPATMDEITLQQIADMYLPTIWEQASQWVATLDPSVIEAAKIKAWDHCIEKPYECEFSERCDFDDGPAYCIVTGCGVSKCPPCPQLFEDLEKFFVSAWCTHTCMRGTVIVGMKMVLHVLINGRIRKCVKLDKPIP